MATTMQRWAIDDYGRANLRLQRVPMPEPRPGEVRVKVAAVAINHRDIMMFADGMGSPLAFPFSPGSDMAGTVTAVGEGTTRFRALGGEPPGVMAEYLSAPAEGLVYAPATLDDAEASTLPVGGAVQSCYFTTSHSGC